MRFLAIGLLLLGACNRVVEEDQATVAPTAAALTYDGADYQTDAEKIAHGKRLATVLDCTGCHGSNLEGSDLNDDPAQAPMYAPNVTLLLDQYTDAQLDQLIRHGRPQDGREFWFMPVESYQFLSDADTAAIIAYLRTFKPSGKALSFRKNADFQKEIDVDLIGNADEQIRKFRSNPPADLGAGHALGRYIAQTTCTACHNNALQGWQDFTPSLDIAGAYSKADLTRLLTTGEGKVKKDLGMMSGIARNSFSRLTPREREAVVDYVLARANRPQ